jgi:hypothetical protein
MAFEGLRDGRCRAIPVTLRRIGSRGEYRHWLHAAASLRFGSGPMFDLVHAWDPWALLGALAAAKPTVFIVPDPMTFRDFLWLRVARRRGSVHFVVTTPA